MNALKDILVSTTEFLQQSQDTSWSPLTPQEVTRHLKLQIKNLNQNEKIDTNLLKVEFAPTSTIQEIAMANGWHNAYLKLASQFDKAVKLYEVKYNQTTEK